MSLKHPPNRTNSSASTDHQVARLGVEQLASLRPVRATEPMPDRIREMLRPHDGLYVAANHESKIALEETRVSPSWSQVSIHAGGAPLLRGLPGTKHGERADKKNKRAFADKAPFR